MGLDCFSVSFAADYGLRDALVLSEICAAVQDGVNGVSGPELGLRFTYLTKEQIREALQSLKQQGVVTGRRIPGKFTREIMYVPASEEITQKYLNDVMEDRIPRAARPRRKKDRAFNKRARHEEREAH
jgi:hypothetical protein